MNVWLSDCPVRSDISGQDLPFPLHYRLAWDSELLSAVLGSFIEKVSACYRRLARARGLKDAQTGAYTVIQCFASSLALNVHFHSLVLEGVYVPAQDGGPPTFHRLAVSEMDVLKVVHSTSLAVLRLLERRGLIDPDEGEPCGEDEFAQGGRPHGLLDTEEHGPLPARAPPQLDWVS